MWASVLAGTVGRPPWPLLLVASLCGWTLLLLGGQALAVPALCGELARDPLGGLRAALALNGPAILAWSWLVMVLAMTPPLLVHPVRRLWRGSLARRRGRAVALFVSGYGAVWMLSGAALTAAAVALAVTAGSLAFPIAVAVAGAWQVTPTRRACLARGHRAPSLRAFGLAADGDILRYGLANGLWCLGTCWPLMLAAMLVDQFHVAAMVAAAGLMLLQRHARQPSPRWATTLV